jgi:hypothetical protein
MIIYNSSKLQLTKMKIKIACFVKKEKKSVFKAADQNLLTQGGQSY